MLQKLGERLTGIDRMAIVAPGELSDFLAALPALESIRGAYLDAEITVFAPPALTAFLEKRAGPYNRVRSMRENSSGTPNDCFDLVLDLNRGSNQTGATESGHGGVVGTVCLAAVPVRGAMQPAVLHYLEIAASIGAPPLRYVACLRPNEEDFRESENVLHPRNGDRAPIEGQTSGENKPVVVLHVELSDRWFDEESLSRVTGEFHSRGFRVVRSRLVTLTIGGLGALLSRARVLIASDPGVFRLAEAVGCPAVLRVSADDAWDFGPLTVSRSRLQIVWGARARSGGSRGKTPCEAREEAELVGLALSLAT